MQHIPAIARHVRFLPFSLASASGKSESSLLLSPDCSLETDLTLTSCVWMPCDRNADVDTYLLLWGSGSLGSLPALGAAAWKKCLFVGVGGRFR